MDIISERMASAKGRPKRNDARGLGHRVNRDRVLKHQEGGNTPCVMCQLSWDITVGSNVPLMIVQQTLGITFSEMVLNATNSI